MVKRVDEIEIIEGALNHLGEIYLRFQTDFPANERKDYNHIKTLMIKKNYKLLIVNSKILDKTIGYAFVCDIESPKSLWIDYMVIYDEFRNAGFGTLLFQKILEVYAKESLGVFIEVEIPNAENEICKIEQNRRIRFYEKLNAKRLSVQYRLPIEGDGFPMYLYFKPNSCTRFLSREQIQQAITWIFNNIHFDKCDRNRIMNQFENSINNECF